MNQTLFRSWKIAAFWAIGISALVAAFFAEGGGHEQFEQSAQQIRDKRANPERREAPAAAPRPAPSASPAAMDEEPEPAFGEPTMPTGGDEVEAAPAPAPASAPPPAAAPAETAPPL